MPSNKTCAVATCLAILIAPLALAEKMSKESKKWLEEDVPPIITPSEEKIYKDLKEADRAEFQKIFWSRRDPGASNVPSPENDFKTDYMQKKAEADRKFRVPGKVGSATDCGRVFILLGEPDEVKAGARDDAQAGPRSPETWTYNDKPSSPVRIKDGTMQLAFDAQCRFPEGTRMSEQLTRMAESRIVRPNLEYAFAKDGRLRKLADLLPKPSLSQTLLKEPRQDFPASTDVGFLKTADGGSALVGVVRGPAESLTSVDVNGKKAVKVVISAQATSEDGRVVANYEQATLAPVGPDGSFAASYRLGLKPGKYAVRAAALDEASKKGSVVDKPAEVPDFNTGDLAVASLIAVRDIEEGAQNDPAHPFAAYLLGSSRLVPFASPVLSKADQLNIFYQYYDAKVDEATGKAKVVATMQIVKGDKAVARAADAPYEAAVGGTVVGPVPLEKYEPGTYTIKLKVTDNITKKDVARELSFEIK